MRKTRYESFGGIIRIENPPTTIYVDKDYMRSLGYNESKLWEKESPFLSAPLDVHFALTNKCPIECRYCYKSSVEDYENDLSLNQIKKIIDVLAEMKVFSVAFGGGEPFAREDIFDIAHYTKEKDIVPNITTNGYYISENNAKKCKVFGHMHISLDLPNEDFDNIKNKGAFQAANNAIDLLSQQGIHIGINCVISRKNFNHLEDLIKFCLSKNIKDISFLRFKPIGRADRQYDNMKLTEEQNIQLFPLLRKLSRKYKIKAQADCSMVPMLAVHKPKIKVLNFFGVQGCEGGNTFIEIKEDGTLRSCSFSNYYGENARNLMGVWDGFEYFSKYRDVTDSLKEPCLSCKYSAICRGGCHVVSEFITGDFNNPDPECPLVIEHGKIKSKQSERRVS
ncbi:MAG: radical SAM/SPASM domain-containing protein [Candidatus Heimdallarchaeaceae archaeon]|jgi:radical SAM protein with 4Fe4S-binding SPASM domain